MANKEDLRNEILEEGRQVEEEGWAKCIYASLNSIWNGLNDLPGSEHVSFGNKEDL